MNNPFGGDPVMTGNERLLAMLGALSVVAERVSTGTSYPQRVSPRPKGFAQAENDVLDYLSQTLNYSSEDFPAFLARNDSVNIDETPVLFGRSPSITHGQYHVGKDFVELFRTRFPGSYEIRGPGADLIGMIAGNNYSPDNSFGLKRNPDGGFSWVIDNAKDPFLRDSAAVLRHELGHWMVDNYGNTITSYMLNPERHLRQSRFLNAPSEEQADSVNVWLQRAVAGDESAFLDILGPFINRQRGR